MDTIARSVLRSEIRLSWDGGDLWSSTLIALGGVCDVLQVSDADAIPASAGYSPGMGGPSLEDYPASVFVELLDDGIVDVPALAYWARVLDRFADMVPENERF